MPDKPLIWLGSSRRDLRTFPCHRTTAGWFPAAARSTGTGAGRLESDVDGWTWSPGNQDPHRRCIPRVLPSDAAEAIYVLHAFEKKTQKTSSHDLEVGRERFRSVEKLRQYGKEKRG
jgi:phage-related protein